MDISSLFDIIIITCLLSVLWFQANSNNNTYFLKMHLRVSTFSTNYIQLFGFIYSCPTLIIFLQIYLPVEWRPASRKSRREQVVISRLRIGPTRLTHSFILKQEPQPQCLTCQTTCTVKHILIECRTFAVIRKRFFKVNNLTDLFQNVKIDDILSFLRETELYQKI